MNRRLTSAALDFPETEEPLQRVVGCLRGADPGPTLICIGGLHGNEPAGVQALRRVFQTLSRDPSLLICGEFVGLIGNLAALSEGRRFLAKDLNRQWRVEVVRRKEGSCGSIDEAAEDRERRELLAELDRVFGRARDETFALDLHTTSGESVPFVAMGDTLRNRRFALRFPLPMILGLEEHLDGTISEFLTLSGHTTITVETGQHASPAAVSNAEAAIWLALGEAGLLEASETARVRSARQRLGRAAQGVPRFLELRYRHPIFPGDGFRMEPGFTNFDPVAPDQLLGVNNRGEIRSRWRGRVLMPLYQELGEDGFFIVREFRRLWLSISALLRRLRIDAVVHWLPGITRHRSRPGTLVVDRKILRWYSMEALHLLGFRRQRALGDLLLVSRRQHAADRGKKANSRSERRAASR
ncbi:MAG: succinylglutamate desuccinylase/aspartoacylase family protein [Gemmatimonadota bacterium]|nr:MAG: succinylglutamate desuccinylase/aspartoacylase family protein [Gemmatimonadota bacterium]